MCQLFWARYASLHLEKALISWWIRNVYLWLEDIGKVKISNGKKITVDLEEDKSEIIPFLLGPVMAILLHQRGGFLVLHGSVLRIDYGAAAFLGYRGFEKSTIAINLYKKGYQLVR